jgi:UTP-glucose-1-phosphate uridylyltransferase
MEEILASKVPELMAFILSAAGIFTGIWKLIKLQQASNAENTTQLTKALDDLSQRHEMVQQKMSDNTFKMLHETHQFQRDISEKTHDVIIKCTVQSAQTQQVLERLLNATK